eukprot:scaffold1430_cov257-Pinguiococcus_pyrenoidosus.AAC.11
MPALHRYKLAMINLDALLKQESLQRSVFFSKGDIAMAESFAGFTHVYMYDLGFPPETREHISKMWSDSGPHTKYASRGDPPACPRGLHRLTTEASSPFCRYLVSYIRPSVLIEQYDMEIEELVDEDGEPLRIPTSMHGERLVDHHHLGCVEASPFSRSKLTRFPLRLRRRSHCVLLQTISSDDDG